MRVSRSVPIRLSPFAWSLLCWSASFRPVWRAVVPPLGRRRANAEPRRPISRRRRQSTITESPQTISYSDWPVFRGDAQATGVAGRPAEEAGTTVDLFDGQRRLRIDRRDRRRHGLHRLDRRQALRPGSGHGQEALGVPTPLGFIASAAVRDGRVYIGDSDGMFYCLDAATGKNSGSFRPTPRSTPAPTSTAATSCSARRTRSSTARRRLGQARLEVSEPRPDPLLSHRGRTISASWPAATGVCT